MASKPTKDNEKKPINNAFGVLKQKKIVKCVILCLPLVKYAHSGCETEES